MLLAAVDPGKITGWFIIDTLAPSGTWWGGELPHWDFIQSVRTGFLGGFSARDRVICEGFTVTPETAQRVKASEPFWSVEQIGILRAECHFQGIPFETPSPSAKYFDRDGSKIKRLDWWRPRLGVKGEAGHRRDAARHMVKWCVDHHVIDLEKLL